MKTAKRKAIEINIFFSIMTIGLLFVLIFDFLFSVSYRIDSSLYETSFHEGPWDWMMYWTHLSNIGAYFWMLLAFIALTFKLKKVENFTNNWFVKNTVFTFIIVTGLIFMTIAYVPTVMKYVQIDKLDDEIVNNVRWISIQLYSAFVILGTTIKHLIVPVIFIYLSFTERNYLTGKRNISIYQKISIQFMLPCFYFIYVFIFASSHIALPPYPIVDFGFQEEIKPWVSLIYIALDLGVGLLFIITSLTQYLWWDKWWNKDDKKKLKISQYLTTTEEKKYNYKKN